MYETLIALVSVHAQVCSIAEQLLDRSLNAIVEELASEALRCFRQVKRFGMGGMLRVRFTLLPVIVISDGRSAGYVGDWVHASDPWSIRELKRGKNALWTLQQDLPSVCPPSRGWKLTIESRWRQEDLSRGTTRHWNRVLMFQAVKNLQQHSKYTLRWPVPKWEDVTRLSDEDTSATNTTDYRSIRQL